MRTSTLVLTILLLILVLFLWNSTSQEGFETAAQDRFNQLASRTNPIQNPAAPIGVSVGEANTIRTLADIALNSPVVLPQADGSVEFAERTNHIGPRIDDENSMLGLVEFCRKTGASSSPFSDAKFTSNCGMCMSQGTLITGKSFTKPTGVLVYDKDKEDAIATAKSNGYVFPRVIPSVGAATCVGASKGNDAKPVLAITAKDYTSFQKRFDCIHKQKIGDECAICMNNQQYTWSSAAGGVQDRAFVFYGTGLITVEVAGRVIATDLKLTESSRTSVPLGKAREGQAFKLTIKQEAEGQTPSVYGVMESKLPSNSSYKLELGRFVDKDSTTNSTPRRAGTKFFVSETRFLQKLVPAPNTMTMVLEGSVPLTFVESDELATFDCPSAPLVGSQASAELFVDHPCLKPKGQGPGNWSDACLQHTVLEAGCSTEGDLYKNLPPASSRQFDIPSILTNLRTLVSRVGKDPVSTRLCTGENISTPCDSFLDGGIPDKQCLVYLYKNQGSTSRRVGSSYPGANNQFASQGSGVAQFCRPQGSLNPETPAGEAELMRIARDGYKGKMGIEALKVYLPEVFNRATGNLSLEQEDNKGGRKTSWKQCFGIQIADRPNQTTTVNTKGETVDKLTTCLPSLPLSFRPRKNFKAGSIQMPQNFVLSFTITPNGYTGGWGNLMHFNATGWDYGWGGRSPGIWFWPGGTRFHVRIADTRDHNWGVDSAQNIPLNSKSLFRLECRGRDVSLTVNDKVFRATQPTSRYTGPLNVWLGCPWYPSANCLIENFCFQPL